MWHNLQLIFVIGDDLRELILNIFGINWLTTDGSKGLGSVLEPSLLDKVSWRLGKNEQTGPQNQCPQKLDGNRDPVRATVVAILRTIDRAVSDKDAKSRSARHRKLRENLPNRNTKLIARHKRTPDLFGRDLGHVQDDNGRYEADTSPRD